jgi:ADP-ribose pyrophosphatase
METWTSSEIIYEGKIVRLRVGDVRLDDGTAARREVVEHPGGVCVVAFTGTSVLFVQQYRIAIDKELLELPAGKLEGVEDAEARGRQELIEEAGYAAGEMLSLGHCFPTVGFCSEKIHIYLARDLRHVGQQQEADERITVVELSLDEVRQGLRENRFDDAKTAIGLYRFLQTIGD